MRISDNMRFRFAQSQLTNLTARQSQAAQRAMTGRRVNAPSNDPVAAVELTKLEGRLERANSYRETIRLTRGDAALAENALAEAGGLFARARELAVQGANETLNASDRGQLASIVTSLRDQLISIANTRGARGYLFSGSQTQTTAFAPDGSFLGDDYEHRVEVGPGVVTTVNVSGDQAFTANGGTDTFQVLADLAQALEDDDTDGITASLEQLDAAAEQIVRTRASAGLLMNRLDSADSSLEQSEISLQTRKAEMGDAEAFETISELTHLSSSLEQAIAVARLTLGQDINRF